MPIIKASTNNPTDYFNLDGKDYQKGVYTLCYDSVGVDSSGDIDYTKVRVGLRSKRKSNVNLIIPTLVTDWSDGTTPFSDFDTFIVYISDLIISAAVEIEKDITEIVNAIQISSFPTPSVMWPSIYLASSFPTVTCDKNYIVLYSTDHEGVNGELRWGKMDNLDWSDFTDLGLILDEYEPESAQLLHIPEAECGDTEVVHLYYHTQIDDPVNGGVQQTQLLTCTGGLLHTATWTTFVTPLGLLGGETHTGYFRPVKRGVSDYIGPHIITGGIPQNYSYSTASNGRAWTRGSSYNKTVEVDENSQWRPVEGKTILDLYGNNWFIGSFQIDDFSNPTVVGLLKLDSNLQPKEFCRAFSTDLAHTNTYIENNIAHMYWQESGWLKYGQYNLANLLDYPDVTFPSIVKGYYKFDDTMVDFSGNTHHGRSDFGIEYTVATSGKKGNISGTAPYKYTTLPSTADFSMTDDDITDVPFTFIFTGSFAHFTGENDILRKRDPNEWEFDILNENFRLIMYSVGGNIVVKWPTTALSVDTEYTFVCEYNGNGLASGCLLRIDDVLQTPNVTSDSFSQHQDQGAVVSIGRGATVGADGTINELAFIKGRVLTAGEKTAVHTARLAGEELESFLLTL